MEYCFVFLVTAFFLVLDISLSSFLSVESDVEVCRFVNCSNHDESKLFRDYHYNFLHSQLDFILAALFRFILLSSGLAGIFKNRLDGPKTAKSISQLIFCLYLTMFMFSALKLLALTERQVDLKQLRYFWACYVCNQFFSLIGFIVWRYFLGNVTSTVLSIDSNGSTETLIHETQPNGSVVKENVKEKEKLTLKDSTSMLKRLTKYCLYVWPWYLCGFTFLVIYSSARMFVPYYTGRVIDSVTRKSYDSLIQSIIDLALLSLISAIFSGLRGGCFTMAINRINVRIRSELFASLVKQEIAFFDMTKTGEITSRLTADCQTLADTFALNVNVFLRNTIMFFGSLIIMLNLSWRLTFCFLIVAPVSFVIMKIFGSIFEKLAKATQDNLAKANDVADEVLGSMRTVRSFANEKGESRRYDSKLGDVLKILTKRCVAYTTYMSLTELTGTCVIVSTVWYGGHLVLTDRMTPAILVSFLLYQSLLAETVYSIGLVYSGLMEAAGASKKVFQLIDREPMIKNDGFLEPESLKGCVEFKNVNFVYPSRPDNPVLKDVSFKVEPGEIVALVGPSGGGKSSCIALLEHFYEPQSGDILLDGIRVDQFNHSFYHKQVSLVGQEPVLYARSIKENISYGLEEEFNDDDVISVSKLANAHQFIVALSQGYDTDVGEKGAQISGGQKQRVAIARAVIRKPKVLLLDEATSALDAESEYLVQQALYENLAGYSVLLIAHRLSTVKRADRIVVIDQGRVVEQGRHEELLRKNGLYKNLVEKQLLGVGAEES